MDPSIRASKEDQVTNYKFKIQDIGGVPYRFPQINLNKRPYSGQVVDRGYAKRAEVYGSQA